MKKVLSLIAAGGLLCASSAWTPYSWPTCPETEAPTYVLISSNIHVGGGGTVNWGPHRAAGNLYQEYVLLGSIFVTPGTTLEIDAGTVIRGVPGYGGLNPATIVVARGGKLVVNGTADRPVIMTAVTDHLCDPTDLGPGARGLIGGVILCGWAHIAENTMNDPAHVGGMWIEGYTIQNDYMKAGDILNNPWSYSYPDGRTGTYNPPVLDDADSSGSLVYLSVRHGGSSPETGKEINGISLYGVGSKTVMHHCDVYANDDDGFEWFGGTMRAKYLSNAFCNDDDFDMDDGYNGKLQFLFTVKNELFGYFGNPDHGFEISGTAKQASIDSSLSTKPQVLNYTLIGPGKNVTAPMANSDFAMNFNEKTRGLWMNGIVAYWPKQAVKLQDKGGAWTPQDCPVQYAQCALTVKNTMFWEFGMGNTAAALISPNPLPVRVCGTDAMDLVNTFNTDPQLRSAWGPVANANYDNWERWLDPRPCATFAISQFGGVEPDPWFTNVAFVGAFDQYVNATPQSMNWIRGWTGIDAERSLQNPLTIAPYTHETYGSAAYDWSWMVKTGSGESVVLAKAYTRINSAGAWTDQTVPFSQMVTQVATTNPCPITVYRITNKTVFNLFGVPARQDLYVKGVFTLNTGAVIADSIKIRRLF